ncbi:MAG: hypothetical protein WA906_00250 [Pacificimonas sp.]
MMTRRFLALAGIGFALTLYPCTANAQDSDAPVKAPGAPQAVSTPPTTDSGIIVAPKNKRVPLNQFMVPKGCDDVGPDEICVTGAPPVEEEIVTTPEPGDRLLDVQSERSGLANLGSTTPMDCNTIGIGGASACTYETFRQWKQERKLKEAREAIPVD